MARNKKKLTKKQKNKRKIIIFIVEIIVLLLLLAGFWLATKFSKIKRNDVGKVDKNQDMDVQTDEVLKKYTNILLLGLDNRTVGNYATGNADTIIIASINNETKEVKLVSVYRDTYLQVTKDGTYSKINSAYSKNDGAKGMMEILNMNLDLDIEDYVSVDWYALVKTINLIDGIDVEMTANEAKQVNKYVKDIGPATGYTTNRVAQEGPNHLDGVQALSYARIRKGVGDDFKRTERQREVISKMVDKVKHSDIITISKLMDEVFPDIETSFSFTEMTGLATSLLAYEITDSEGFPLDRDGKNMGRSGSCVIPVSLEKNVRNLHTFLFENDVYTPSLTVQQISDRIINDTGMAPAPEPEPTTTAPQSGSNP